MKTSFSKMRVGVLKQEEGGLGVKYLSTLNKALLCKWNWRFANEREVLWN